MAGVAWVDDLVFDNVVIVVDNSVGMLVLLNKKVRVVMNGVWMVILRSEREIKVYEFTGKDAEKQAHGCAQRMAVLGYKGSVSVAEKVREYCKQEYLHLSDLLE